MNSSVSALLTVLVLLAGFSAASLTYLNVYAVKAAELRESALEAEASSELLHAYVYRDVSTNNTLLTLRNAGKVALEVTDIVLVDRAGGVVKAVKLNETLKLSPQQYRTMPFATLAGEEYRTYDDTYSSLSAAYFKTFRGRVYGSRYLAPPVVEVAAYETSRTTLTSQVTSTESLTVVETTQTLTSWTATVIIDNPSHWPIKVYTGVAHFYSGFYWKPDFGIRADVSFPGWGLLPGLQAKSRYNGRIADVTSPSEIKIPKFASCWTWNGRFEVNGRVFDWESRWTPTPSSAIGPVFVGTDWEGGRCRDEYFFPDNAIRNVENGYEVASNSVSTGVLRSNNSAGWGRGVINITFPPDHYPLTVTKITLTSYAYSRYEFQTGRYVYNHRAAIYSPIRLEVPTAIQDMSTYTVSGAYEARLYNQQPLTIEYLAPTYPPGGIQIRVDYIYNRTRNNHETIGFPTTIQWYHRAVGTGYYISDVYKLAYVVVVDLWNTTNIVAYSTGDPIRVYGDRPLGIAAVYTYDRTDERLPPPPPPPSPPQCMKSYTANICESSDVGTQVWTDSGVGVTVPCDSLPPDSISVSFGTSNPDKCDAYVAPGAGTYSIDGVQACDKSGSTISCNVPPGATIITDCKH